MKIVINIPEELYKKISLNNPPYGEDFPLYYAVRNGTPLPKGHGDLIDINNINEITLEDSLHYMSHKKGDEVEWYIDAPIIVEADTTRDCKTCGHSNEGKCAGTEECHECMFENKYIEADKEYEVEVVTRGNCMMCGKELTEGLFFCKECEDKRGIRNEYSG